MSRLVVMLGAAASMIAGCKYERRVASQSSPVLENCLQRYGSYRETDELTCANPGPMLGPTVAGPGLLRTIFDWPVPGVPRPRANDGFFVLDLTPAGQSFVASGGCPRGEPVAMSWDAQHDFHVICKASERTESGQGPTITELRDLSLVGDRFVERRRPLVLELGPPLALPPIVAYPDHGEPVVFYAQYIDDPLAKLPSAAPVHVRRWADGALPYVPRVTPPEDNIAADPLLVIVQSGVVRFVVSAPGDDELLEFRLVEPGATAAIDRGALVLDQVPAGYGRWKDVTSFDASQGDQPRLDLVVARSSDGADDRMIRLDNARAVPGADATNVQRCPDHPSCDRLLAIAGSEQGCVCTHQISRPLGDGHALGVKRSRANGS